MHYYRSPIPHLTASLTTDMVPHLLTAFPDLSRHKYAQVTFFFAYLVALVNVSKFGSSALALTVRLLLWLMTSDQMLGSCTLSRKKGQHTSWLLNSLICLGNVLDAST